MVGVGEAVGVGAFVAVYFGCFVPDFFAGVPVVVGVVGCDELLVFWLGFVGGVGGDFEGEVGDEWEVVGCAADVVGGGDAGVAVGVSGDVVALVDGGDLFGVPVGVGEDAVWFDVGEDVDVVLLAPLFGVVEGVAVGEVVAVGLFGEEEVGLLVEPVSFGGDGWGVVGVVVVVAVPVLFVGVGVVVYDEDGDGGEVLPEVGEEVLYPSFGEV